MDASGRLGVCLLQKYVAQWHRSAAGLRSLAEPWADTTSPTGRMVLTVFAGIAEFECALIRQRTSTGRVAAKARGGAVRSAAQADRRTDQSRLAPRQRGHVGPGGGQASQMPSCHAVPGADRFLIDAVTSSPQRLNGADPKA